MSNLSKEMLLNAVQSGNIDEVNQLLKDTEKLKEVSQKHLDAALLTASKKDNIEIIKTLLMAGANIEAKDKFECTSLLCATFNGNVEIVKLLLEAGANIDAQNNNEFTALISACYNNNLEMVRLLLKAGPNLEIKNKDCFSALLSACANTNLEILELLIQAGAKVNGGDDDVFFPLVSVTSSGCLNSVKALINNGANVNQKTKDKGQSSLFAAVKKGYLEIAEILIHERAEINLKDNVGNTPLHIAAWNGQLDAVHLLVKYGANIYAKNKYNEDAFQLAMNRKHNKIVEYLKQQIVF